MASMIPYDRYGRALRRSFPFENFFDDFFRSGSGDVGGRSFFRVFAAFGAGSEGGNQHGRKEEHGKEFLFHDTNLSKYNNSVIRKSVFSEPIDTYILLCFMEKVNRYEILQSVQK